MSTISGDNEEAAISLDAGVVSSERPTASDAHQSNITSSPRHETSLPTRPASLGSQQSPVVTTASSQSALQVKGEPIRSKTGNEGSLQQVLTDAKRLQATLSAEAETAVVTCPETKTEQEAAAQRLYETATLQDLATFESPTEAQWTTISDALLLMVQELSKSPGYQDRLKKLILRLAATLPKAQMFVLVNALIQESRKSFEIGRGVPKPISTGPSPPARGRVPNERWQPMPDGWRANVPVAVPRDDVERPVRRKGAVDSATLDYEENLE